MADIHTDTLVLRRQNRLKLAVGTGIGALSVTAALLLYSTRELHGHGHHLSFQTAYLISLAMWCLMSVAMMLPTAWNMIATYLDIGFAARSKQIPAPPVSFLIAGYVSVWVLFSMAAAFMQVELVEIGLISASGWPPPVFSGGLLVLAGLFELTTLKNHCLTKCRNPFATMLGRFRPERFRIYRIGLEQGLYCLGCCWALMILMFAAGVMNFFWMAALGALMAAQKHGALPRFERKIGPVFIVSGLALIAVGVA